MRIFKKLWKKLKKQKIVKLDICKDDSVQQMKSFKESLKTTNEKACEKRKKVQSHICYGDGLGIKKKLEC